MHSYRCCGEISGVYAWLGCLLEHGPGNGEA
jgi:hypothetical protein